MKKFPWKPIFIGCCIMTVLVIAKGINTAIRTIYAHAGSWLNAIFSDPWTYVGIACVLIGVVAFVMWRSEKSRGAAAS